MPFQEYLQWSHVVYLLVGLIIGAPLWIKLGWWLRGLRVTKFFARSKVGLDENTLVYEGRILPTDRAALVICNVTPRILAQSLPQGPEAPSRETLSVFFRHSMELRSTARIPKF